MKYSEAKIQIGDTFFARMIRVGDTLALVNKDNKIIFHSAPTESMSHRISDIEVKDIERHKKIVSVEYYVVTDELTTLQPGDIINVPNVGNILVTSAHHKITMVKDILAQYNPGSQVLRLKT
jgi:hypothetical protein